MAAKPKSLRDVADRADERAQLADAFAHLQRVFPGAVWRHDETGAVRIGVGSYEDPAFIEWSPHYEKKLVAFRATFGGFRFTGKVLVTAAQLEALQQYAAAVETAPPPAPVAQAAA